MKIAILSAAIVFSFLQSKSQVGIGTTSPSSTLDLESSDDSTGIDINNTAADGNPYLSFQLSGTSVISMGVDDGDADKFKIGTTAMGSNTSVTINTSGQVGINDTEPGYQLEVEGPININGTTANTDFFMIGGNHALSMPNTDNLYIGEGAGALFDASGSENIFIGKNAGTSATSGTQNQIIGAYAGDALTTGIQNVLIGSQAGSAITSGNYNIAIGRNALRDLTSNQQNTVIGWNSGTATTGGFNSFYGANSGNSSTSGQFNSFYGRGTGQSATTATHNTLMGNLTGDGLTTGGFNTLIGSLNGRSLVTGTMNTIIGYNSGPTITGDFNTFVGALSGANTTGQYNTFLGYQAGDSLTSGSRNVCLGYQAGPTSPNANGNLLFIDNSPNDSPLIYGDFSANEIVINGNSGDNTNSRTFFTNGEAGGTGAWNNDSDERLKKNIRTIDNPLDKILALRGVNYEWIDTVYHDRGLQMGFIAQETETVIPEVVDNPGDDGYYSMQYAPITALLVEGVKEQNNSIVQQEKTIEELLIIIENLQKRIQALEEQSEGNTL